MKVENGRVWKFGADIDTDAILPAQYLNLTSPDKLAQHCFEITHPEFCNGVKTGDIIVADTNFGCGSSREHAPVAIKAIGVKCVIAESFARIFYRNAFNIGLPVLESREAVEAIENGDEISVNISQGKIINVTTGDVCFCEPLPPHMLAILEDGGLIQHLKRKS